MPSITNVDDQRYVKALSHPLRVRILGILEEQPASPVELSQVLDATLGTISYHVRQLNELGLLELVRETPRRGAIEHHYRAKPRPKSGGATWDSVSVIAKQAVIGAELAQTTEVASRAAGVGGFDSDHARLERLRLSLDAKGVEQLSKAVGQARRRGAQDPGSRGQAPGQRQRLGVGYRARRDALRRRRRTRSQRRPAGADPEAAQAPPAHRLRNRTFSESIPSGTHGPRRVRVALRAGRLSQLHPKCVI